MAVDQAALRQWFDTNIVPNEELEVSEYSGYDGYNFVSEVRSLSEALSGNLYNTEIPLPPVRLATHLMLDLNCDSDGIIDGFIMSIPTEDVVRGREPVLGWLPTYVTRYLEQKGATDDREATGVAAAWAIVFALASEWDRLVDVLVVIRTSLGIPVESENAL